MNTAQRNKSQSLPKFLSSMLIFFTSDGQFLDRAAKSCLRKINLKVHSLKFASFLAPIVSHLDSHHISYPPARPPIVDLSATVAKNAGKFSSPFKMGFPPKRNKENIISLEALWILGISTTLQDGK